MENNNCKENKPVPAPVILDSSDKVRIKGFIDSIERQGIFNRTKFRDYPRNKVNVFGG